MRRPLLAIPVALFLLAVAAWMRWPGHPDPVDPSPVATTPAEAPPVPAAPPKPPSRTFHRPAAPATEPGDEPASTEAQTPPAAEAPEPVDILDLPDEDRDALAKAAMDNMAELGERCDAFVPDGGVKAMALITLDPDGLLELELSAYDDDGQSSWTTDTPLPDDLMGCLDDVLWEQQWPAWADGVRFGLTLRMQPEE